MTTQEAILAKIQEHSYLSTPITEATHLYTDLGLDSLAFIALLSELEELFGITFEIGEMEPCLCVGHLISEVTRKTEGGAHA